MNSLNWESESERRPARTYTSQNKQARPENEFPFCNYSCVPETGKRFGEASACVVVHGLQTRIAGIILGAFIAMHIGTILNALGLSGRFRKYCSSGLYIF